MPKTMFARLRPVSGPYDQVPCCLFSEEAYRGLSLDAKLLYARMLSLTGYAAFKGREDKQGLFIVMSRARIMDYLGCAQQKATKVLRELIEADLAQLDNEGNINNGRIYLKPAMGIMVQTEDAFFRQPHHLSFSFWKLPRELPYSLSAGARILYAMLNANEGGTASERIEICKKEWSQRLGIDVRTLNKYLAQLEEMGLIELHVKEATSCSGEPENALLRDAVNASASPEASASEGTMRGKPMPSEVAANSEVSEIPESVLEDLQSREELKRQLDVPKLTRDLPTELHAPLETALDLLCEMTGSGSASCWIGGRCRPASEVRRIMQGFGSEHLRIALDAFAQQRDRIHSPSAWLRTVLLNVVLEDTHTKEKHHKRRRARSQTTLPSQSCFRIGSLGFPDEMEAERRSRFKAMCDRLIEIPAN